MTQAKRTLCGLAPLLCHMLLGASCAGTSSMDSLGAFGGSPESPSTTSTETLASSDGGALGASGERHEYDVVIVGAGAGGSAAALQAARLGAKVALVEPTDWVGGQMTGAGVPNMDGGRLPPSGTGIYAELRQQIVEHYADATRFPPAGKAIGTCYWSAKSTCFEPHVGRQLLELLLVEAGVALLMRARVVTVDRTGDTVTGVTLADGRVLTASVVVDATEHGDLLPLAGAAYRAGNTTSEDLDLGACIQDLTYVAVIKRYPGGVPAELKIDEPPPGYAAHRAMFDRIVTRQGSSISFPITYPVNWAAHSAYRGVPDSSNPESYTAAEPERITKTAVNWANDFPGDNAALSVAYLEDPATRAKVDCRAKLLTLSFIYHLQTELGQADWSVADDEGYDTAFNTTENRCPDLPSALRPLERLLPVMPYVRESRRLVAVKTLTAKQIKRVGKPARATTRFVSAIAVGDYPTDLHGCGATADLEADLGETPADNSGSGPFQVPLEVLIPAKLDGLLAAEKNIGVSRLAAGAIRLQPIAMATGQAVGVLAALAVRQGVPPREVRSIDVQKELVHASAPSALALDVFADVPMSSPLWPAVQLASVRRILGGTSSSRFGAASALTREQAAVMLARLFELDVSSPPASATFSDVPPGRWSFAHVEAVHRAGITGGCAAAPPAFCPSAPTTRAQMAALLARALERTSPGQASALEPFVDVPPAHPHGAEIQLVAAQGLMVGCAGGTEPRFCPDQPLSRGDAARVAARVLLR